MASILRIKRSELSGNPAVLAAGELAYSALADNGSNGGDRLYIGMGTETSGNAVNHVVIGGKRYTDLVDAATHNNTVSTLVRRDSNGDFSARNITATSFIGTADAALKWLNSRTITFTGDLSGSITIDGSANVNPSISLASISGLTAGSYGGSSAIPVITVDAKGRITAVSTQTVASSNLNISGNTGTDAVDLSANTLSIIGGTGVSTTVTDNTVTINLPQAVGTTSNVTFNNVTVNGVLNSNDITAANISVDGNATITGNLTVQGTTTTVNSSTVAIGDKNIELAKDATSAAMADGGGITILGPTTPATLSYTSGTDRWAMNKDLTVTQVFAALKGNADTATKWATARTLEVTGDAAASLSVDGSQNVSATITLSTVNSNVGSFGSSTSVPAITVNAKGLVTAVTANTIPTASTTTLGLARFDSAEFSVTSGIVSIIAVDGGTY